MKTTKTPSDPMTRIETRLRSAFGFTTLPFTKDLRSDQAFQTDNHRTGLERLGYLVDRRGIGAVFGTPGTGKSTLLRTFLDALPKTSHVVVYVDQTNCAVGDLFREIARGFGLVPRYRKADVMRDIKDQVLKLSRQKKVRPVLVLDDAHLLPCASLDEVRLLTSFDHDSSDDLTVILAGHPQLETNLRLAVNEALAQRLVLRVHLRPLGKEEVADYLVFRLEQAGRTGTLFLPDAVEALFRASRGIPRVLDRLAEHCLLLALKAKKVEVDADLVTDAVDEVDPR